MKKKKRKKEKRNETKYQMNVYRARLTFVYRKINARRDKSLGSSMFANWNCQISSTRDNRGAILIEKFMFLIFRARTIDVSDLLEKLVEE